MNRQARARALHHTAQPHYNCAQSTLLPFAEELGLPQEAMYRLAAQFGSGMRRGSVCGAVTGGLMALGLLGADSRAAAEFQRRFAERTGALDCAALLTRARETGEEKKAHCDRMVLLAVALVEELSGLAGESSEPARGGEERG